MKSSVRIWSVAAAVAVAVVAAVVAIPEVQVLVAAAPDLLGTLLATHAWNDPSNLAPLVAAGGLGRIKQAREELQKKQDTLHKVFEEAKTESGEMDFEKVKSLGEGLSTTQKAEKVRAMNDELTALGKEVETLEAAEKALKAARDREEQRSKMRHPNPSNGPDEERKSQKGLGELFVESDAYLKRAKGEGPESELQISAKALFETGAGWAPETIRTGRVVESAQRPIQVLDLIPMGTTNQAAVVYMEETTATSGAAEKAEGAEAAESEFALTERSSPVRKITTFLPITDEQLEDVAQAQGYVDRRLRFFLRQRLDAQVLLGDGNAPNLRGLLSASGLQSQAKGADPIPDAIFKAMTKVRVTGRAIPGAVVIHPTNWQSIRLMRTNDGVYIWGNPSEAGPERIWGLPVAQSDAITLGTALVGDFANFCEWSERMGVEVKISDSHADYFAKGKQAIRARIRGAFIVYRGAAFCEVTGL